ncbi:MAG: hypothetical protein CMG74_02415 [Candidatus Marinimicrobia bacterium]|nr:hypothetical protein [Candidatus Neomarinimicrobiota bacterium]|tara:strand:- start:9179 stop:14020 length:4842 start_codon:yes stop_codon:yes gene_type:complete
MESERIFKQDSIFINYKLFLQFFIFLFFTFLQGQANFEISGNIVDKNGEGIRNAKLNLYLSNKLLFMQEETGRKGNFEFKKLKPDKYTLNVYGSNGYSLTKEIDLTSGNAEGLELAPSQDRKQPQLNIESSIELIKIEWSPIVDAKEYIIYKDNQEVSKVSVPEYQEQIGGGKSYAYNVVTVFMDGSKGSRSLTEYGKSLFAPPDNISTSVSKNTISLKWDKIEDAKAYVIYKYNSVKDDWKVVNATSKNSYKHLNLDYETQYIYTIATMDHHKKPGDKSEQVSATTHPEIKKIKGLKAEAGDSQISLTWKAHPLALEYKVYLNGSLADTVNNTGYTQKADPGTESCFTVSPIDKYGIEGPQSDMICKVAQFPPPENVTLTLGELYSPEMNSILVEWERVVGASFYNLYRDGKVITNTPDDNYKDLDLDFGKEYSYQLSSLTNSGLEGPLSDPAKQQTPQTYKIAGRLVTEEGKERINEAKIFLYTEKNELWAEYTAGFTGKFTFDDRIVAGTYRIKAYGNGYGNNVDYDDDGLIGGEIVEVKNKDVKGVRINLATDGLRPRMKIVRGVQELTITWEPLAHAESYNVYKNGKPIAERITAIEFLDEVAPGKRYEYWVRAWDLYELEGPESNKILEKSSYQYPTLKPTILQKALKTEGSGRFVNLEWVAIPGVTKYAVYRDGERLSIQSELTFVDTTAFWGRVYNYQINSIDNDGDEGANSPELMVETHPEVPTPEIIAVGDVNSVRLEISDPTPIATFYKVFRNGSYLADSDMPMFIDNVAAGEKYCYAMAAVDRYGTEGEQSSVQCAKGAFAPPSNLKAEIVKNEIELTWSRVANAPGYHLYRNDSLVLETKDMTYFKESLEYDRLYTYRISSFDQDGDDGPFSEVIATTHEEVLDVELAAMADLEKVTLNWSKSNLKVYHQYRLYRDDVLIRTTEDTSYLDYVTPGTYFCYKVKVIDKFGTEGPASLETCQKVLVQYPKDLVTGGDVRKVVFKWQKMPGAVHYNIYLMDKKGKGEYLTKVKGNYYEHKGLEFDTEYCYQVSSVDIDGDEGPRSKTMCGWVLPAPHLSLIEKIFIEPTGNSLLDGRENGLIVIKVTNDGRSPARELRPWLEPVDGAMTPSLIIDSVKTIPILYVGDTITISFPLYAKLKIESGIRNFNIRIDEFADSDLEPVPISFETLKIIPPNFVIADFAIDNEWGQNYIPPNEIVTLTVRFQNLSEGKSDTASLQFRRDSSFVVLDKDELHEFGLVPGGKYYDFSFEVMSRENNFTVYFDTYDYFETRKTIPIHLELMKNYKNASQLKAYSMPYPLELKQSKPIEKNELVSNLPKVSTRRETIGIVFGNHKFMDRDIPGKTSTDENVKLVRNYFHDLFGIDNHQIVPSQYWFFNNGVTRKDFGKMFNPDAGYIIDKIESSLYYSNVDTLDLILYFSGEGTTINGKKCLLPQDAVMSDEYSFYSLDELYSNLSKIQKMKQVRNITLFMDVDFNNPAFKQNLVSNLKEDSKKKKKKKKSEEPVLAIEDEIRPPDGITALFASNINQLSYTHPDANNGVFTYYLLKGLRGEADNGDKSVTVSELHDFISKNVQDTTAKLYADLPQIPLLFTSDPDRILYRLP